MPESERRRLRMSDGEVSALLEEGRKAYVTTNGPGGWPHVVPLSYVLLSGELAFWTDGESRKVRNLRCDDRITCLIEDGERVEEFRGVQLFGRARIVDDHRQSVDAGLQLFARYSDGPLDVGAAAYAEELARQRVVVRVAVERVVSWDHRKTTVDLRTIGR